MFYRSNNSLFYETCGLICRFALYSFLLSACIANASEQTKADQTATLKNTNSSSKWFSETNFLDNLKFQGFASQAFIATSDNNVFGKTDQGGGFGFTEIGLNALFRPLPRLQLSAQMLSRRAGKGSNGGEPRLDFGFVDYLLFSHETHQFGIRIGRLKNPFGFYNDTRDVAFTRPSILLPQSIYFDRTRNLGLSSDSVQLYGETSHPTIGNFSVQFGVMRSLVKDRETEYAIFRGPQSGELSPEASFIGRGVYETHDARFRFAISGIWLNTHYNPGLSNDKLARGSFSFSPLFLSAQYNAEKWSLTAEYALRRLDFKNFGVPALDKLADNTTGESFYVQGVYRFHPKWEALLRYDVYFADRNDRNGKEYAQWQENHGRYEPAYSRYAKDLTVGLRWNITPQIMARFEYHHINGTGWLSGLDNPSTASMVKEWDLFAAQLSFRF